MPTKQRSTSRNSEVAHTNTKKRVLRELPLVLLSDASRLVLFILDAILVLTFACGVLWRCAPGIVAALFGG